MWQAEERAGDGGSGGEPNLETILKWFYFYFFFPLLAPRQSEENSSFAAASNFAEEKAEKNLKATQITRSYYILEETLVPSFHVALLLVDSTPCDILESHSAAFAKIQAKGKKTEYFASVQLRFEAEIPS